MRAESTNAEGEALLRRLQRLLVRAGGAGPVDRRQTIALLDDIDTARRGLLREREQIQEEMGRTRAREIAIAAYLRGSRALCGRRRNSQRD